MQELKMESKEFRRIIQNLRLEGITLHPSLQKRVVELITSGVTITPAVIKDTLKYGKV
ncbi:Zn-dependent hydrolase [Lentibacillus salinarum]|uniref:Zn-dependent hydrolase n=1 Tax=Lentibacillus salinarum TaxID=446820 RepID=A0ABW3ZW35_9BACI